MPAISARSRLYVEGTDDLHAIANLVEAHGIDYRTNASAPEIEKVIGVEKLLKTIETAVELAGGRAVGFASTPTRRSPPAGPRSASTS